MGSAAESRGGDTRDASDSGQETREAPTDPEETRGAPSDSEEETRKVPLDPEEEIQEASSDPEVETKGETGPAAGSTKLRGLVVPARLKLVISSNPPPNSIIAHVESKDARKRGRSAAKVSADGRKNRRGSRRGECIDVQLRGLDDFAEEGGDTGTDSEGYVTGTGNRQQAMDSLEMEQWRKARKNKKCKRARPNDKLVVRARILYEGKIRQDSDVEKYKCRLVA